MACYVQGDRHRVTPRIITPDPAGLIDFICRVFAATGDHTPDRPVDVRIGDSIVMVSDGGGVRPPMPAMLYVYVADADATFAAAIAAGAEAIEPPADRPWGDRVGTLADAWGNIWQVGTYLGVAR